MCTLGSRCTALRDGFHQACSAVRRSPANADRNMHIKPNVGAKNHSESVTSELYITVTGVVYLAAVSMFY